MVLEVSWQTENQAQEILHPSNDNIGRESNPKNVSVPADHQSIEMHAEQLHSDGCCARGDDVITENERGSVSSSFWHSRSDKAIDEVSEENSIEEI